jgi:hypothetical protein
VVHEGRQPGRHSTEFTCGADEHWTISEGARRKFPAVFNSTTHHLEICGGLAYLKTLADGKMFAQALTVAGQLSGQAVDDPIVATFDVSGKSPQCSQGRKSYMKDCCFGTDFYFYIVAEQLAIGPDGVGCTAMGWNDSEHIFHGAHDPIFHGMDAYWRGGDPAFSKYDEAFHRGHDGLGDIGEFLAAARDSNSACTLPKPPEPLRSLRRGVQGPASGGDANVAVLYDTSGTFGICLEASYFYLRDCVVPSDFFSFMLARAPTISFNTTCSLLGYGTVGPGTVFKYQTYWKGGKVVHDAFMAKYRAGHPDLDHFLARTRDGNQACGLD